MLGYARNGDCLPFIPAVHIVITSCVSLQPRSRAVETARRYGPDGILSNAWNPGNLNSELQRHMSGLQATFTKMICYPPVFGGYTELYAACSPDLTPENNGAYVIPWGRIGSYKADIGEAIKAGNAEKFWAWSDKETREYA